METIIVAKILFTCPNINLYPPREYNQEDKYKYEISKEIRKTERGKEAIADADWSFEYLIKIFSKELNIEINKEKTPILYDLLNIIYTGQEKCHYQMTKVFYKQRPYVYMKEKSAVEKDEEKLKEVSSFPSGQAQLGWIFSNVLAKISPEDAGKLLVRGFEYGESRVITGYHWDSDVEISRLLAEQFLTNLYKDNIFQKIAAKAQIEVANQKAHYIDIKFGIKKQF